MKMHILARSYVALMLATWARTDLLDNMVESAARCGVMGGIWLCWTRRSALFRILLDVEGLRATMTRSARSCWTRNVIRALTSHRFS